MTTQISRIEIFCDDKLVGPIQRLLAHVGVIDVKATPVANARVGKNGKLEAESSGDLLEMFVVWAKKRKVKMKLGKVTLTPDELRTFMTETGRSANSYHNLISRAQKAKILKKTKGTGGKTTSYDVIF